MKKPPSVGAASSTARKIKAAIRPSDTIASASRPAAHPHDPLTVRELREIFWRFARAGHPLPPERNIIVTGDG